MNFISIAIIGLILVFIVESATKKSGTADLTNYESYPNPNSKECRKYNGCKWSGRFVFVSGKKSKQWVKSHDIIAIHNKDSAKYKLKTFKITQGKHQIIAKVYDECSDNDCNGCCTQNSKNTGFLIDMEKYTLKRFGGREGVVNWTCLDC